MRIKLALGAGLTLLAVAVVLTLSRAPLVVARSNLAPTHGELVRTRRPAGACQTHELIPAGTLAMRFGLTTVLGPKVTVSVWDGSRLLTHGIHAPGWEGASVTVAVKPVLRRTFTSVEVCLRLSLLNGIVEMLGWHTGHALAARSEGKPLPGRMHIEYLRSGRESWWSMALATARRLGLGRPASGTWNALLVIGLAGTLLVLSSWLLARELQ